MSSRPNIQPKRLPLGYPTDDAPNCAPNVLVVYWAKGSRPLEAGSEIQVWALLFHVWSGGGALHPPFSLTHPPVPPADPCPGGTPVQAHGPADPAATAPELQRHSWTGGPLPLWLPLPPYPHCIQNDLSESKSDGATVLLKPSGRPPTPQGEALVCPAQVPCWLLLAACARSRLEPQGCRHTASAAPYPCLTLLPAHLLRLQVSTWRPLYLPPEPPHSGLG